MIFFVPYLASGFSACGKLFASLFGIKYVSAMLISAAVIVIYTVMGGFLAASFTDLVQSIIMTVALVVVLGFGVAQAGGMEVVMDNARSLAGYLSLVNIHDPATGGSAPYSLLTICSLLAWGLGYFGMPHILLRFMAIEEEKKAGPLPAGGHYLGSHLHGRGGVYRCGRQRHDKSGGPWSSCPTRRQSSYRSPT